MYTVKSYDRLGMFKVVKMPFRRADSLTASRVERPPVHHDVRLSQSLSRSRSAVRDYALANDWDYFVTFTFDPSRVPDRFDLQSVLSLVRPFLHELGRNKSFRYLIIPEQHKDGAWHFHGFMSGIDVAALPPYAPKDALDAGYVQWPLWSKKFGYNTVGTIDDPVRVSFYVTKYITKSLCASAFDAHEHTYFHSRGLKKSFTYGSCYLPDDFFESKLMFGFAYCSVGYFQSEYDVVSAHLEEFRDMKSYYMIDDVTGDFLGLFGGSDVEDLFSSDLAQLSLAGILLVPAPDDLIYPGVL